jgi:hypothetical protein
MEILCGRGGNGMKADVEVDGRKMRPNRKGLPGRDEV